MEFLEKLDEQMMAYERKLDDDLSVELAPLALDSPRKLSPVSDMEERQFKFTQMPSPEFTDDGELVDPKFDFADSDESSTIFNSSDDMNGDIDDDLLVPAWDESIVMNETFESSKNINSSVCGGW